MSDFKTEIRLRATKLSIANTKPDAELAPTSPRNDIYGKRISVNAAIGTATGWFPIINSTAKIKIGTRPSIL